MRPEKEFETEEDEWAFIMDFYSGEGNYDEAIFLRPMQIYFSGG